MLESMTVRNSFAFGSCKRLKAAAIACRQLPPRVGRELPQGTGRELPQGTGRRCRQGLIASCRQRAGRQLPPKGLSPATRKGLVASYP